MYENLFTRSLSSTILNLNGSNYPLWTQSFMFVGARRKIKHIFKSKSNLDSIEKVTSGVIFLNTTKNIWTPGKSLWK